MSPLSLAYSPCPNDTFIFGGIATGQPACAGPAVTIELHDVETLNKRSLTGVYDISKVSFHAYLLAREHYQLLSAGAALGFGCGPVVVGRSKEVLDRPQQARVALPGELTTAALLFRLWKPQVTQFVFVPYDRVLEAVKEGDADAGVIIHETRFVYEREGLMGLKDLGSWWEEETGLPIPLGGIVARRTLGSNVHEMMTDRIRRSIRFATNHPEAIRPYIRQHACELDEDVLDQHIAMFVNDFSIDLGEAGVSAVNRLKQMTLERGILS